MSADAEQPVLLCESCGLRPATRTVSFVDPVVDGFDVCDTCADLT